MTNTSFENDTRCRFRDEKVSQKVDNALRCLGVCQGPGCEDPSKEIEKEAFRRLSKKHGEFARPMACFCAIVLSDPKYDHNDLNWATSLAEKMICKA
jgi:hypothetical protein